MLEFALNLKKLRVLILLVATITGAACVLTSARVKVQNPDPPVPVLVELFTSEGCSSCPPADALLAKLDRSQPVAGAELIVLSEHVDYWNYIGWKDPYSSHIYSDRQNSYAQRFGSDRVYTPQMIVDGSTEFVGSDARSANQAITQALKAPKIKVRLSDVSAVNANSVKGHVEIEALPASFPDQGEIYLAVAFSHAESSVSGGENAGRRLPHTAVVRKLMKIGTIAPGQSFSQDVEIKAGAGADPRNLRLIAFVQQPGTGRVLGVTMQSVDK
jgi:hypothetical protein